MVLLWWLLSAAELLGVLQSTSCFVDAKYPLWFGVEGQKGQRALPCAREFVSAEFLVLNINFSVVRENNCLGLVGQVLLY